MDKRSPLDLLTPEQRAKLERLERGEILPDHRGIGGMKVAEFKPYEPTYMKEVALMRLKAKDKKFISNLRSIGVNLTDDEVRAKLEAKEKREEEPKAAKSNETLPQAIFAPGRGGRPIRHQGFGHAPPAAGASRTRTKDELRPYHWNAKLRRWVEPDSSDDNDDLEAVEEKRRDDGHVEKVAAVVAKPVVEEESSSEEDLDEEGYPRSFLYRKTAKISRRRMKSQDNNGVEFDPVVGPGPITRAESVVSLELDCLGNEIVPKKKGGGGGGGARKEIIPLPRTPFKAQFDGIVHGGLALFRFMDTGLIKAVKDVQDELNNFYTNREKNEEEGNFPFVVPRPLLREGMLVVVKWPQSTFMNMLVPSRDRRPFGRARVTKLPKEGDADEEKRWVKCQDMDNWRSQRVPLKNVYIFPPHLLYAPFNTQSCKLKGLEFYTTGGCLNDVVTLLPPMEPMVEIVSIEMDKLTGTEAKDGTEDKECAVVDAIVQLKRQYKTKIPQKFLDKDKTSLRDLFAHALSGFTRKPRRFVHGQIVENAYVSIVEDDGRVWVTLNSGVHRRLTTIGENPKLILTSEQYNKTLDWPFPMTDFEYSYNEREDRRFLARFLDDRRFYRVDILEYALGSKEVKVRYVDFGNTETIPLEDVMPTAFVDPVLNSIVPQVFPARLNGIETFTDSDKFFEIACIQEPQRLTYCGSAKGREGEPVFDLYLQIETENAETGKLDKKWVYANQRIVDEGAATAPGDRRICKFKPVEIPILAEPRVEVICDDDGVQKTAHFGDRYRYLTSCRIDGIRGNGQHALVQYFREHDM